MKKLYLLSGIIALGAFIGIDARALKKDAKYKQPTVEEVQREKIARQKELARPATYKMVDSLVRPFSGSDFRKEEVVDWTTLFAILDSMRGVIDVNEYCTPLRNTLLGLAAEEENIPVIRTLCEKYKANPYRACYQGTPSPLDQKTLVAPVRDVLRYYARNF